MHPPRLAAFGRGTHGSNLSSRSADKVIRRFAVLVKFQLALSFLSSQAMESEIMETMRLFPLQFSLKARTVFFFCLLLCSMQAWRRKESSVAVGRRSEVL